MGLTDILEGVGMILKAIMAGLQADPDIDTSQTEATLKRLNVLLDDYREARKRLDSGS